MYGDNADSYYKGSIQIFLYKREDRAKDFWDCVDRERVGFKNLAAASDFLRIEYFAKKGVLFGSQTQSFHKLTARLNQIKWSL